MSSLKKLAAVLLGAALVAGCAPARAPTHPATEFGRAVGYVVASPVLILKGLVEGIASTPYFIAADLRAMNDAMVRARAPVDLARTYRYAYNQDIAAGALGQGRVFRSLGPATAHFQAVLRGYGVPDAGQYHLTAVRTADSQGYTLYAVVRRPNGAIRVRGRDGRTLSLRPGDPGYYRPYRTDAAGRPLDLILDWAAVPRTAIATQQGQAVLMTIGAHSVLINRRSDDFWRIDQRWRGGAFRQITERRKAALDRRLR